MKKSLLLLFSITIVSTYISLAQIGFGIKAGGHFSDVEGEWNKLPGQFGTFAGEYEELLAGSGQNIFESEKRLGAHGGIYFNIPLNENFSIETEFLYSMRGTNFSGTIDTSGQYYQYITYVNPVTGTTDTAQVITFSGDLNFDYDIKYKLHYLDVPITAKYKFSNGLFVNAGPYFSFLLASQFQYNATLDVLITKTDNNGTQTVADDTFLAEETLKEKEGLNTVEIGFIGGIGYEFPFGLGISARYMRGFTEVFEKTDDDGFRTSVIQLSVSYKIFNDLLKFE